MNILLRHRLENNFVIREDGEFEWEISLYHKCPSIAPWDRRVWDVNMKEGKYICFCGESPVESTQAIDNLIGIYSIIR